MIAIGEPYDFATAVRVRRKELGLTQRELALAAGLGRVSVLRLENEPDKCQLRTALRVAEVLGLELRAAPAAAGTGTAGETGQDAAFEEAENAVVKIYAP